jgi:phospholipid-translocating ATPase
MHNKTWLPLAACALSISLWFFFSLIIGVLPGKYSKDAPYRVVHAFTQTFGNTLAWWAVAIIGIAIVVGLNLGVTAVQRVFFPTDRNLWQEIEKHGDVEKVAREYNMEAGGMTEGEGKRNPYDGTGGKEEAAAVRISRDV